ncbi:MULTISPECIES: hypothetical protein [unclassified Duganella]|uniref:hypothetical protein n=1 Tax=unclassified Duganella TaxID=2636909 RepID=UPI0011C175EF|nr:MULTISPECIES: hypothetical protein [unclassified Duganella]
MTPQAFLQQECKNVAELLKQTLRYEYGLDGSQDFYDECDTRLKFIEGQISISTDPTALSQWGFELNDLSKLICRIERSSLGEYSWPFVEEVKKMANAICIENTASGKPSKIYVLADGGLDAYRIFPEPKRPSHRNRLLLTIVFPKSLKHFVLLHSILGHELGHAIWRCSKHEHTIKKDVCAKFLGVPGVFADKNSTLNHIFSPTAPAEVQAQLPIMAAHGINQANFFQWANWDLWVEEILCDFVGLVSFGPSFVAAQCNLLPSINPNIHAFGPQHPPTSWRINLILRGATILGFDALPPQGHPSRAIVEEFWTKMQMSRTANPWFDVLSDAQLTDALSGMSALLQQHPPACYMHPDVSIVSELISSLQRGVPPVGFTLDANGDPLCTHRDFREILYAGWIAAVQPNALPFEQMNRLCEHAIMQQGAIDIQLKG